MSELAAAVAPTQPMPASYYSWLEAFPSIHHATETLYMDFIAADQRAEDLKVFVGKKQKVIEAKSKVIADRDAEIKALKRKLAEARGGVCDA